MQLEYMTMIEGQIQVWNNGQEAMDELSKAITLGAIATDCNLYSLTEFSFRVTVTTKDKISRK